MTKPSLKNKPVFDREPVSTDGRRQRSDRSRRKIIEALFDLLRDGEMNPSAVTVAERANVGLRTVFRHFEDMDSIYNEMTDEVMNSVMPKIIAPYEATDWKGRLFECIEKRADLYETVFPVKLCLALRRFQSHFLAQQYERDVKLQRSSLQAILPAELVADTALFNALEATLAFSTWRRLRQDQGLSVKAAKATLNTMLNALVKDVHIDETA